MVRLDLQRIRAAADSIDPVFVRSSQYESAPLSGVLGCSMVLKVETLNPVRSFKGRGTETVMSSLARNRRHFSAVCASAGNLGQALAYSGAHRRIPVTVFAATTANPLKIERMRGLGATVHLDGDDIELPRVLARAHAEDTGGYLVEDSLDVDTCEGAATVGLEVVDDVALVDDDSIKHGMRHLFEHAGLVVEPSAALGVAAVLEDPERFRGRNVATVICGSNVTSDDFRRWALDAHHGSTTNDAPTATAPHAND